MYKKLKDLTISIWLREMRFLVYGYGSMFLVSLKSHDMVDVRLNLGPITNKMGRVRFFVARDRLVFGTSYKVWAQLKWSKGPYD